MNLTDFIPKINELKLIQGVEGRLQKRKRNEMISLSIAIVSSTLQAMVVILNGRSIESIAHSFVNFMGFISLVLHLNIKEAIIEYPKPDYELALFGIIALSLIFYLLFRKTKFLFKLSEEPFRYTFWIEPFRHVRDTDKKVYQLGTEDKFHTLLHHDLIERLNGRVKRLSLLNVNSLKGLENKDLSSHIHISGEYTIREEKVGECIIQIWPRISIGALGTPQTLAKSVKYSINNKSALCKPENFDQLFNANHYNHLIERIYSSVSTHIYQQIKMDLKEKIDLFPTKYLKAIALYYEAEDFARSNTIDAYDHAIELYRESRRYFDITVVTPIRNFMLKFPILLWRKEIASQRMMVKVELGYAKCLIYRRQISALSGRAKTPLFENRRRLGSVIKTLHLINRQIERCRSLKTLGKEKPLHVDQLSIRKKEQRKRIFAFLTFQGDSWKKYFTFYPWQSQFDMQRHLLFKAYLISAVTYYYLYANQKAREFLEDARAVAPDLSEKKALYFFTLGVMETDINKKIQYLNRSVDLVPDFQIAQFILARTLEIRFRRDNEITKEKAGVVIAEYEKVLQINPGNIASIASLGYLYWLIGDKKSAKETFKSGYEIKASAQQTFIGELSYGLARLAVEEDELYEALDYLDEAVSADPGVGAYSVTAGKFVITPFYESMGSMILKRYTQYKKDFEDIGEKYKKKIEEKAFVESNSEVNSIKSGKTPYSHYTIDKISSFVLNDCGNAYANYFLQVGDEKRLNDAIDAYEKARHYNKENAIVYYNLSVVSRWRGKGIDKERSKIYFKEAKRRMCTWPSLLSLVMDYIRELKFELLFEFRKYVDKALAISDTKTEEMDTSLLSNLLNEFNENAKRALSGKRGISKDTDTSISPVFPSSDTLKTTAKMVKKFLQETQLAPLFFGTDEFQSIRYKEMESAKLNENDLNALILIADMWSIRSLEDSYRKNTIDLCLYIKEEFYPEHFDINMIIRDMCIFLNGYQPVAEKQRKEDISSTGRDIWIAHFKNSNRIIKSTICRWITKDPKNYSGHTWLSKQYGFKKETIIERLQSAVQNDEGNPAKYKLLGDAHFSFGAYETAKKCYQKAINIEWEVALYWGNLGAAFTALKQHDDAIKAYEAALSIESDYDLYWYRLGNLFFEGGQYGSASEGYLKAMALLPFKSDYHEKISNVYSQYMSQKQWVEAIEICKCAMDIYRKGAEKENGRRDDRDHFMSAYYAMKGDAFMAFARKDDAICAYNEALKIDSDNDSYWNRLGNAHYDRRKFMEANTCYQRAIEISPNNPVYHANLSLTWESAKHTDQTIKPIDNAIDAINKAIVLDPENLSYRKRLMDLGEKKSEPSNSVEPDLGCLKPQKHLRHF